MQILTNFSQKPIPTSAFDWTARFDGYEPGQPLGYGSTEQEAINDLLDNADVDRLALAAPALLAALRRCALRILVDEGRNSPIYEQARAAIVLATGECKL